ncbi:ATP-dependent DNA ligase [Altericroceibacterium xinjiangense]|uniref:ATP-dependent DNA ligase n=1 Tax=Altericroceibacterium xinjiangense TaxID=762261 RepID=UPI000F7F89E0|nr:ATP-dependent DNA ligase [Altericroceibacterium xinjiangense]
MTTSFPGLSIPADSEPMEARLASEIPAGEHWQFEPKWDGFRCLAFRGGDTLELFSKAGKPLARYFPEIAEALLGLAETRFVLDGELVLPHGTGLSFADLQLRLHPAASRIGRLARETPACLMLFDCLQLGSDVLASQALTERRRSLKRFFETASTPRLALSPVTQDRATAQDWFDRSGTALDGIVAKRIDEPYRPGERAMVKAKKQRTADCVVGGFRMDAKGERVGSLLLGLYDQDGRLNYVGYVSSFTDEDRAALPARLDPARGESPFTGKSPGGPSRWSRGRNTEWIPLRPELVIEVIYDQVTGERFRHGTSFLRWRDDKRPDQCTMDQLKHELRPAALKDLLEGKQ